VVAVHYKKDDLLKRWTSSSDISGYHADFHEGHGTVGAKSPVYGTTGLVTKYFSSRI